MANIAFSALCNGHDSTGVPDLISYQQTLATAGAAWDGVSTFVVPPTAPENGLYYFSIEFVNDAYNNGGTSNDVWVQLERTIGGTAEVLIAAWAAQGAKRTTGAASTILPLKRGSQIRTRAHSANGERRNIAQVTFSGFLIA